jgi:hypothetical protein
MLKTVMISFAIWAVVGSGASFSATRLPKPVLQVETSGEVMLAEDAGSFAIKPSEAALIAKNAYPEAKVLNVRLLPSGEYAVTLKVGGSVQRVLVNATSGELS